MTDHVSGNGYTESLQACARHVRKQLPASASKAIGPIWREIAEEIGIGEDSAYRWFDVDAEQAIGINRFKLWIWLEKQGYRVTEFIALPEAAQNLVRLFCINAVTMDEMVSATAIVEPGATTAEPVVESQLRAYLRTGKGLAQARIEQLQALIELHQDTLSAYLKQVQQRVQPKTTPHGVDVATQEVTSEPEAEEPLDDEAVSELPAPTAFASPPSQTVVRGAGAHGLRSIPGALSAPKHSDEAERTSTAAKDEVVRLFAAQANALLPLAELLESDLFSAEERVAMRELVGNQTIFTLSNRITRLGRILNELCSERSRSIARKGEG